MVLTQQRGQLSCATTTAVWEHEDLFGVGCVTSSGSTEEIGVGLAEEVLQLHIGDRESTCGVHVGGRRRRLCMAAACVSGCGGAAAAEEEGDGRAHTVACAEVETCMEMSRVGGDVHGDGRAEVRNSIEHCSFLTDTSHDCARNVKAFGEIARDHAERASRRHASCLLSLLEGLALANGLPAVLCEDQRMRKMMRAEMRDREKKRDEEMEREMEKERKRDGRELRRKSETVMEKERRIVLEHCLFFMHTLCTCAGVEDGVFPTAAFLFSTYPFLPSGIGAEIATKKRMQGMRVEK